METEEVSYILTPCLPPLHPEKKTATIGLQTDACINIPTSDLDILFCMNHGNDVSTQTNIVIRNPPSTRDRKIIVVERSATVKMEDKRVGSDNESFPGFGGMSDIENDHVLRQFTGINRNLYNVLLRMIELRKKGQPAFYKKIFKENRLLLFLMKLRLGLSFGALGCMFHVHPSSANRVFTEVLQTLKIETKDWISAATKKVENEQNEVVLDKTDETVEAKAKILMFTNHKGVVNKKFAVAFNLNGEIIKIWEIEMDRTQRIGYIGDVISFKPGDLFLVDYSNAMRKNIFQTYDVVIDSSSDVVPKLKESTGKDVVKVEKAHFRLKSFRILHQISGEFVPSIIDILQMCCIFANSKYLTVNANVEEKKD